MRLASAVCNAVLIATYVGFVYGGATIVGTDIALILLEQTPPTKLHLISTERFWISTTVASSLYLAFCPAFRWSFVQDAFRLPNSTWKMRLHTLYLLNIIYPLMIHTATEMILKPKMTEYFVRLLFNLYVSAFFTFCLESLGGCTTLRNIYLQDLIVFL
jgi:hypothetical protein